MIAKFGVPPASIPDYLALVGDSSDGYPGLAGLGREVGGGGAREVWAHRKHSGGLAHVGRELRATGRALRRPRKRSRAGDVVSRSGHAAHGYSSVRFGGRARVAWSDAGVPGGQDAARLGAGFPIGSVERMNLNPTKRDSRTGGCGSGIADDRACRAGASAGQHAAIFSGILREAGEDLRRRDQSRARRVRSAAPPDARRAAVARVDAAHRAGAREGLHGGGARSARLRRQQQAARRRRTTPTTRSARWRSIRSK